MAKALVTGASSGIGLELAKILAKNGYDLLLCARSEAKLKKIAQNLKNQHGVKVDVISMDLSVSGAAKALYQAVTDKFDQIDILINNAGFGLNGSFGDLALEKWQEMMHLNMVTLTELSYYFANDMRARNCNGRIMNISSVAAFQSCPWFAVYGATKSFVLSFSEALRYELAPHGISVTAICPGATATPFHQIANSENIALNFRFDKVEDVAQTAYDAMMARKGTIITGVMNKPLPLLVRLAPRALVASIAERLAKPDVMRNIKARHN
ncbi:MAG: SDR family oxidoreductase [Deltaproteobacteria bacterium]|nr:SDR family oxidoreductase [Deltaproteobacteria bacterium]